ncbi:hypothetical protein WA538_002096 [Blastocystis sp. DL]
MVFRVSLLFLTLAVSYAAIVEGGISFLTKENLDYLLENGKTVLGVWNAPNCVKCGTDFWDVHYLLYAYKAEEEDFFILGTTTGTDPEFDRKYKIDAGSDGSVYRLFVKGEAKPYYPDEDIDLLTWISLKTGYSPEPDYVFHLTDDTHSQFLRRTKKTNALIFLYIPQNGRSQEIAETFFTVSSLFHKEKSIIFAKVNCLETPGMCGFFNAPKVPAFRYLPFNTTGPAVKQPHFEQGEDMIDYLNAELGTFVSHNGGLNQLYGREPVLDTFAHSFMEMTERKERLRIMKKVANLKNVYRASYKYYKLMKDIVRHGEETLTEELETIEKEMKEIQEEGKEYAKLVARRNVAHQFVRIDWDHKVVMLDPYNFDYVLRDHNVLVKFFITNCTYCETFAPVFEEVAKESSSDVVFAELNVGEYPTFGVGRRGGTRRRVVSRSVRIPR